MADFYGVIVSFRECNYNSSAPFHVGFKTIHTDLWDPYCTCFTLWDIFEIEVIFFSTINQKQRHLGSKKNGSTQSPGFLRGIFGIITDRHLVPIALAVTVTSGQDQHVLYVKRGALFFLGGREWVGSTSERVAAIRRFLQDSNPSW